MNGTISVADLSRQRLADRVVLYRQIINRLAGGARLTDKDDRDAGRAMRQMGLPDYAFRRDIRAWAESAHDDDRRLAHFQRDIAADDGEDHETHRVEQQEGPAQRVHEAGEADGDEGGGAADQ